MKIIVEDLSQIEVKELMAVDTETISIKDKSLMGVSLYNGENAYYLSTDKLRIDKVINFCKKFLENQEYKKIFHNAKFDMQVFLNYGINTVNYEDTMIMAWLCGSGKYKSIGLKQLTKELFNKEAKTLKEIGMKKRTDEVPLEILADYAMDDVINTMNLYNYFTPLLDEPLRKDYEKIELPIINLLVKMENSGIAVDLDKLNSIKDTLMVQIVTLENDLLDKMGNLYTPEKGKKLSLNSPKQIKEFLLLKGIEVENTDINTLSNLKDAWIKKLLEYRKKYKLFSTYVENLLPEIEKNKGVLKGQFNQAGTETGRFSSSKPNLQNLPAHDGIEYRSIFVPRSKDKIFIVADYSQIELRVLAHFSKDVKMIQYFNSGHDLHSATAHGMFKLDCPIEDVKDKYPEVRFKAKSINFGLIYGMGAHSLAEQIKVSKSEAEKLIGKYFEQFPSVKKYIQFVQKNSVNDGFVKTIFGRKRYFPELKEGTTEERQKAYFSVLRKSINTKIQGSAADLMKLAMIKLNNAGFNILLQVHDEVVIEASKKNPRVEEVKQILENIYPTFRVPLLAEVNLSNNWLEGK